MKRKPSAHPHAIERLQERFGIDEPWLIQQLEQGKFIWLKGAGDSKYKTNTRYAHLMYISIRNTYCIVVMDRVSNLVITVLTEEMGINSSWGRGLDEASKLHAKKIALGTEVIDDINFLLLYAEQRGELSVKVIAKTVAIDWKPICISLCKTTINSDQINIDKKHCSLSNEQMELISSFINAKLANKEMRAYCQYPPL